MTTVVGGRTYTGPNTNPKVMRLTNGVYELWISSVEISGGPEKTIPNVTVEPGGRQEVQHEFSSGILKVGAVEGSELVDAAVGVYEVDSGAAVGQGRTYTAATSNPKTFVVEPGRYRREIRAVRLEGRPRRTIEVVVEKGGTSERTVDFGSWGRCASEKRRVNVSSSTAGEDSSEHGLATGQTVYGIDDRPPLTEAVPLGIQHVLAMLLGNITIPLLAAGALGLATEETALLIQMVLVMAGLATIVQSYPVGPIGGRIPIVMGTSVAFLAAIIAVATDYGLATVFGACLAAALVEVGLGFSIVRLRRFFPPLVNAIVVMLIGLTLIPVGMDYAAGGRGAGDYGSTANLLLAGLVFIVTLVLNQYGRGFVSYASLLAGVVVGWIVALALGRSDLAAVGRADWFALPQPLAFGLDFAWGPILLMSFIYLISTMETIGDISGTLAAVGREPTTDELKGGLVADGVMSGLAALFSAFPNTSYSQNVGLVNFTGVASRHVTAIGGLFLLSLGVVPKVGALFATIPAAVIGGGGLIMFAMIFASGAAIFHRSVRLTRRSLVILAVALGLGLGIELRPEILVGAPGWAATFFGSGLIVGGLSALLLNVLLPEHGREPSRGRSRRLSD